MKKFYKAILFFFFIAFFVGGFFSAYKSPTLAQFSGDVPDPPSLNSPKQYVPLAPLPFTAGEGTDDPCFENNTCTTDPSKYLSGLFKIGIALAGLFAVVMIVIGGIEYMSTDAVSGKSEGKEKIQNAITGLLIALLSWLVLYTINPRLLEFHFFKGSSINRITDETRGLLDNKESLEKELANTTDPAKKKDIQSRLDNLEEELRNKREELKKEASRQ